MPSIRRRHHARTFYLDTSTLSYAFRGGHPEFRDRREPDYAPMFALVGRIAREANLCLSSTHVAEMAHGNRAHSDAALSWLASLDTLWTFSFDKIGDREDEVALQRALGATPHVEVEPFARNMTAIFRDYGLAAEQRSASINDAAEAARILGLEKAHLFMDGMGEKFHYDRNGDPKTANLTHVDKAAITAQKRRALLEDEGARAWDRLRHYDLPEFHARYRALTNPNAVFADYVLANPTALPSTYVAEAFGTKFVEVMARRKPGGNSSRALRSSLHDYAHLGIGAAYCDVFTCDALAADCLRDAPEKIGRRKPFVFRRDVDAFVHALESELATPSSATPR